MKGFRCPRCGGEAVFDAATQTVRCPYCESIFDPEEFDVKNESAEVNVPEAGMALFTCGGCGAELQGTEDSIVGFCPYCGGQSMLKREGETRRAAEKILPFQISREECAERYKKHAGKARYLPKELTRPEHLESFVGIYMPYYEYDVEIGGMNITGTKTVEHNSRYDVVNTYRIDASVEGSCTVPFDASRYLDDEIAERTLPFDMTKARPFDASYLSGFYADASTVPAETYYQDAAEAAASDVIDAVGEQIYAREGITVDKPESTVEAKTRGFRTLLLPMWFLTWRKGDRVAYAVVNGESGKVVSDLPVDMGRFAIGCVLIAAALFAVLELFFQPTPLLTSVISLLAGIVMASAVKSGARRVFEKQTHANDKGWTHGAEVSAQPEPAGEKKKVKKKKSGIPAFVWVFIAIAAAYYVLNDTGFSAGLPQMIAAAAVVYLLIELRGVARWQKQIPEKQPIRAILLVFLGVLLNAAIVFISPVNDAWYYLGDAACILILILASVSMTRLYNIGTTRPLPKLFDRKEAGRS